MAVTAELSAFCANIRLEKLPKDVVNRARVFAGHAGGEPGQLEAEMEEESWIVEPALREDVFTEDPEGLWSSLLRRKGGEYVVIATMPDDPTLN